MRFNRIASMESVGSQADAGFSFAIQFDDVFAVTDSGKGG